MTESSAPTIFMDSGSRRQQLATNRSRIKKFLAEFAVREFVQRAVGDPPPARMEACDQPVNEREQTHRPAMRIRGCAQ